MLILMFYFCLLLSVYTSVFKTKLTASPQEWSDDSLYHSMNTVLCVRDQFKAVLSSERPSDYDVNIVFNDQQLYDTVKVLCI